MVGGTIIEISDDLPASIIEYCSSELPKPKQPWKEASRAYQFKSLYLRSVVCLANEPFVYVCLSETDFVYPDPVLDERLIEDKEIQFCLGPMRPSVFYQCMVDEMSMFAEEKGATIWLFFNKDNLLRATPDDCVSWFRRRVKMAMKKYGHSGEC